MQPLPYQTIKLGRGKHTAPEHGACVMELASMLAGEAFSDHPDSVSPTVLRSCGTSTIYSTTRSGRSSTNTHRRRSAPPPRLTSSWRERERVIAWGDERWQERGYAIHALGTRISDEKCELALQLADQLIAMRAPASGEAQPSADLHTSVAGPAPMDRLML
jgi:hypothetical protein